MQLIFIQAVTVPVVVVVEAVAGADGVVAAGDVTTVADTEAAVAGVTVAAEEDATGGELRSIAMIQLILYNVSRFGSAIDQP